MSVDPEAKTGVMASLPRDLARFPLWKGGTFTGKINSLMSYARRHPEEFPDGPTTTLVKEVGYLVGVPVHYYAAVNLEGFVTLIDLVGGVTVDNERAINDPAYGGWTDGRKIGFYLPAGKQRLDGQEALAFVRSRKGAGDNDFTRARRQQQLLLALQKKMTDPAMLPKLPAILDAAGDTLKTNFPASRLSEMLDLGRSIEDDGRQEDRPGPALRHEPGKRGLLHPGPRHGEVRAGVDPPLRRGQPLLQEGVGSRVSGPVGRSAALSGPGASRGPSAG